jgi:hypothetical protein
MIEVTLLLLAMLLIATCIFFPKDCGTLFSSKSLQQSDSASNSCLNSKLVTPVDSTIKHNFLAYLQSEIESALFPRPTDSVLQRHYDTLVSAELENRLAAMPDS